MPIINQNDAVEVEQRVRRVFDADSTDSRIHEIRRLFVELLDFDPADGEVGLQSVPNNVEIPGAATRVAALGGTNVVYVPLGTRKVRNAEASAAVRLVSQQLHGDLLAVFSNGDASQLHFIYPSFEGARPTLRRMVVERDLPRRTAVMQLSNIYWHWRELGSLHAALESAFDVEAVTRAFFAEYKRVFDDALDRITGFGASDDERENRRQFTQTLFNRLMFVYFISRKGWLSFNGDKDYLNALWKDYQANAGEMDGEPNFCYDRLRPLFFGRLNNPSSEDPSDYPGARRLTGKVPFLNGGLFEETDLDKRLGVTVPDGVIRSIFDDLFDRFNFTVMESTPFDVEVAVDPEMLGKVFEELVTGRHDSGAYYTPRPVVSFMCREALKGYLGDSTAALSEDAIHAFVENRDTTDLSVSDAREIGRVLEEVTVVDPACGSGAYLLGMMQELVELQTALYNVGLGSKSLYDLKLQIIERNLYGADLDVFAVNIAMLRLWLSLSIEYDAPGDPRPLPNLDFKIVCGDSLLGPDPSAGIEVQGVLGYDADEVRYLGRMKGEFMRTSEGGHKDNLRNEIQKTSDSVRASLGVAHLPETTVDWRIEFAEVFFEGGFDIAIANPPYIQLQRNGGRLRRQYQRVGYKTLAATGDIYQLFFERGCQLVKRGKGLISYITSNSWMRAQYGRETRRLFTEGHSPLRLLDLGKDVFDSAIVDSCILLLREGGRAGAFPAVDMDKVQRVSIPSSNDEWEQVQPSGEAPWSIMSALEQSVMDKMLSVGTPLKEWDIEIYRGITTGLNAAFIIDNQTKEALVAEDPKSAEILKPVLRGRDIQRYQAEWAGLWLIATFPPIGLDIEDYPSVKRHLLSFGRDRLEQSGKRHPNGVRSRKRTSNAWFEMQDTCAYHEDFTKEKLFWIDLTEQGRFAYSTGETFCVNSAYMMTGNSIKYLCAVLNSHLISWFMASSALNSGMGTTRWVRFTVDRIPVPLVSCVDRQPLEKQIDDILISSADDRASGQAESEINRLVYQLYGLKEEEVASVEDFLLAR